MFRDRLARMMVGAALVLPVPALAGDWPDPSVIRDNGQYVGVTTSEGWAPVFRIVNSPDLANWRLGGAVFRRAPRWAKPGFWAPEITRLADGGYAVFYSARSRRRQERGQWYCLGVATANNVSGPYRDLGKPLRCGRRGSIDAFPMRDENGVLHLLWKEDGNEFNKPTPIYAQRLREDGRRLSGPRTALIRNRSRWERMVVEAPALVRRGGFFYMFYSGNLCCTKKCAYAIGVARSPNLLGPWRKFEGNPIMRAGNGWRCPGHAAVVDDQAIFHAYRSGFGRLTGRQVLVEPVSWGPDGWPAIGSGLPSPPTSATPLAQGPVGAFDDSFAGRSLAGDWEWPAERPPGTRVGGGLLRLTGSPRGHSRLDAGVLSRRLLSDRYRAVAVVERSSLRGRGSGGLAAWRNGYEAIGIAVGRGRTVVWERRRGRFRELASAAAPRSRQVTVRMVAAGGRFRFEQSRDGVSFRRVGRTFGVPIEETARFVLTAGGAPRTTARFASASLEPR